MCLHFSLLGRERGREEGKEDRLKDVKCISFTRTNASSEDVSSEDDTFLTHETKAYEESNNQTARPGRGKNLNEGKEVSKCIGHTH